MKLLNLLCCISILVLVTSCTATRPVKSDHPAETNRRADALRKQYAAKLGIEAVQLQNLVLYEFIDTWYGTPYRYAGNNRQGIDCSGFTHMLYRQVYKREVTGSSASLFEQCKKIDRDKLQEGDLVFFRISKKGVSHVGIYLQNNKFVHASTRAGVIISDLNEAYYQQHFYAGGRLP